MLMTVATFWFTRLGSEVFRAFWEYAKMMFAPGAIAPDHWMSKEASLKSPVAKLLGGEPTGVSVRLPAGSPPRLRKVALSDESVETATVPLEMVCPTTPMVCPVPSLPD